MPQLSTIDYPFSRNTAGWPRVSNREAATLVQRREQFYANNHTLYGVKCWDGGLYVVYSYGPHFPLVVWDPAAGWLHNQDHYSATTARHAVAIGARSLGEPRSTSALIALVRAGGVVNAVAERLAA